MPQTTTSAPNHVLIPWPCLYQTPTTPNLKTDDQKIAPKPPKSFAQALTNVCDTNSPKAKRG